MAATIDHAATFRQEAAELMTQLEEALLDMADRPDDRDLVDSAFRALHTLKGSGAMFGFDALAAFTHHIENAFDMVRSGDLAVGKELINLTLAAMDHIRILVDAPQDADQVRCDTLIASYHELTGGGRRGRAARHAPEARPAAGDAKGKARQDDGPRTWRIRFRPGRDVLAFGTNPLLLLNELRGLGQCTVAPLTDDVPPLEELDPTACHIAWDILITTDAARAAIEDVFIFVTDQSDIAIDQLPSDPEAAAARRVGEILVERGDIAPEALDETLKHQDRLGSLLVHEGKVSGDRVQSALIEQRHLRETGKAKPAAAAASIRVPAERLDSLMDQVGELVIAQARLAQLAAASSDLVMKSVSEDIGRLASELRDTTMSIRMLPIGTLFGKFRRVVHDLSAELGKSVELTMAGEDTELDKTVIESMNDLLVHLIRNSIDHGIESAEDRRARGKPASGRVHLAAVHSGAQVLITISDDGRGMDRSAIRAKAEEKGMLAAGQEIGDAELFGLVFQPGFSTAKAVTSVSGRGVGMDVVKRTIDGLRGSIDVASTEGKGSSITLKLPLTLAIIDGLLVRVARGRYVIPLSSVEECVELTREEDMRSGGRNFLNIRGEIVPFLRLREVFGSKGPQDVIQKVTIVSAGEVRVGLVVDQVIGQYQTVIKSLSTLHKDVEGFSGATILGDGTVALILDIPRLIAFAQEREMAQKAS